MSRLQSIEAFRQGDHLPRQLSEQGGVTADLPRDVSSFPERLLAPDMAVIYRVSLKRFYALAGEGVFDFAVIKPSVGKQSWSRERVRLHLAGELRGLTGGKR